CNLWSNATSRIRVFSSSNNGPPPMVITVATDSCDSDLSRAVDFKPGLGLGLGMVIIVNGSGGQDIQESVSGLTGGGG
ncbi:MAG: hypothetical protein RL215_1781, partial [Planctomycetota bacterium]